MTLKSVFEVAAAIIASIGGGSVIIFGLSSWLGKVWANRILEKEKSEHSRELEFYKSELEKELDKINAFQDRALYISKSQYDNEHSIYLKIWGAMHECIVRTSMLYPKLENIPTEEKEREEYQKEKYSAFVAAYNEYSKTIDKFAPFYKEDFYDEFVQIRNMCDEIGRLFFTYEFEVKYSATFAMARDSIMETDEKRKVYIDFPNDIKRVEANLRKEIREYLLSLQLK